MKVVILAGGFGSRLSEETDIRPKPMVEIGGKPIIWHIMKYYSHYGINEFYILCGYKSSILKNYFYNYLNNNSDFSIDLRNNSIKYLIKKAEPWKVTLLDTGEHTMTGGRLNRVKEYIDEDENFCMTYGDGLSTVNIEELIKFHKSHNKKVTMTTVLPQGKYGIVSINDNKEIFEFEEKPNEHKGWINGGFFVLNKSALEYVSKDEDVWEQDALKLLSAEKELKAFEHKGFWKAMDTQKDKVYLEELWKNNNAPWKKW